jgi:diketogulonate reductase-like aldo/keto reductase
MVENINVLGFELSADDIATMAHLDTGKSISSTIATRRT